MVTIIIMYDNKLFFLGVREVFRTAGIPVFLAWGDWRDGEWRDTSETHTCVLAVKVAFHHTDVPSTGISDSLGFWIPRLGKL